jgi:hypothetical protein
LIKKSSLDAPPVKTTNYDKRYSCKYTISKRNYIQSRTLTETRAGLDYIPLVGELGCVGHAALYC